MRLNKCLVCGEPPTDPFPVNLCAKGVQVNAWCIQCVKSEDEVEHMKWSEHSLYVYGDSKKEASVRWNMMNN